MASFKSQIVTQASGSVGGTTFAHNKGGLYMRARSIPVNPNSTRQQEVRANMSILATAWLETLTQAQRDGWENWAQNNPITSKLGDPLILSGQQMYNRCNMVRLSAMDATLARVDAPPTAQGLAELIVTAATPSATTNDISVDFDNTLPWANEDGAAMIVQTSRQMAATKNFFKGPWRFGEAILGDSTTPPSSGENVTNGFGDTYTAGNKAFIRAVVTLADGRISPAVILNGIAV